MNKKLIFIILGLLLLIAGSAYSVPVLMDILNYLKKNYSLSGWGQNTSYPTRLYLCGGGVVLGLIILIIGLKAKKAVFRLGIFSLIIVMAIFSGVYSYKFVVSTNNTLVKEVIVSSDPAKRIQINIPLGANTKTISEMLKEEGIIKYPYIYVLLSKLNGYDSSYKSGVHYITKELNYDELMKVLSSNPESIKVTIPEGFTYKQITDLLEKKKLISKAKFDSLANSEKFDYKIIQDLPSRSSKLEGYLFPDTYEFGMDVGEKEIIKRLVSRFNDVYKPEYYDKAKTIGMTTDKIIILASIIEREARDNDERKIISGVFYNRMKNKDKMLRRLQSCATIQYIFLNSQGIVKEKLTEKDTQINDPYNTYMHEGLPPGPICSPGKASIEAALNPEKTDYLYFVAKGDSEGTHQFSKTLKEHQAAAKKYGVIN